MSFAHAFHWFLCCSAIRLNTHTHAFSLSLTQCTRPSRTCTLTFMKHTRKHCVQSFIRSHNFIPSIHSFSFSISCCCFVLIFVTFSLGRACISADLFLFWLHGMVCCWCSQLVVGISRRDQWRREVQCMFRRCFQAIHNVTHELCASTYIYLFGWPHDVCVIGGIGATYNPHAKAGWMTC